MLKHDYTDEERFKILIDYLSEWILSEYKTLGTNINIADSVLFNLIGILNITSLKTEKGFKYLKELLSEHHFEQINLRFLWFSAELQIMFQESYIGKIKLLFEDTFCHASTQKLKSENIKKLNILYKEFPWIWVLHILQIAHNKLLKSGELKIAPSEA